MKHRMLRGIALPILRWLISTILLALSLPSDWAVLTVGYALLFFTFLLTWWFIAFARWLRNKFGWENLAYFLSNLALGFMQVGIGGAIGFAVAQIHNTLATLIFLFGCVVGIGWLLTSIWRRLREWRHKQYNNIFWRPLESNARIWRVWQPAPAPHSLHRVVGEKTGATAPTPAESAANPLFRRVPLPTESVPSATVAIPIPPRDQSPSAQEPQPSAPSRTTKRTRDSNTPPVSITVTFDTKQESFVAQAQRLVARTEAQAKPVPFSQYRPTYAHMSPEQQHWYFYWRAAVRSGRFLPADLSYLFVYVYECINLVGFDTPQAAFDRLAQFWQHYRVLQPKLDHYLIDWLADFLVIHRLPTRPLAWYGQVVTGQQVVSSDPDLQIESWLHAGGNCNLLPSQLLYRLADYSPEHSKFYQTYQHQHNLDAAYQKGVHAVDCYLRQSAGIPLFMSYMPQTARMIQRPPFAGALHEYGQTQITIGQVRPWQAQEPLTTCLKSILKQTENVLREQLQFKTKLRGIDLPSAWINAIQQAIITPVAKRTVDIDFESVALLKRDSEEIRRRLFVEDEAMLAAANRVQSDPEQEIQQPQNGTSLTYPESSVTPTDDRQPTDPEKYTDNKPAPYLQRPADTPVGILTDLGEIAAIMSDRSSSEAHLLAALRKHNWQAPPASLNDEKQGGFLNVLLDQINERAVAQLGDALVFDEGGMWVVAEDYRDEIAYILDHPAYAMTGANGKIDVSTVDIAPSTDPVPNDNVLVDLPSLDIKHELPIEWVQFSSHFQEHHWATVTILLQGIDVNAQVDGIARRVHSTANQLIDQINEFALDSIGDILIITQGGTPMLEDEHLESLRRLCIVSSGF